MSVFRFKQFSVDQTGCGMKVNTDGVLLAALADHKNAASIVDIGTGTGVMALMLAQKYPNAFVDAVEIDEIAAATALKNFIQSPFNTRLALHPVSFQNYFTNREGTFDLIISNPPFFLNSLKNPDKQRNIARHTDISFFEQLVGASVGHLSAEGKIALILPVKISKAITELAQQNKLFLNNQINIRSFASSAAHRHLLTFGFQQAGTNTADFVIYQQEKEYSQQYRNVLKDFFLAF